MKEKYRSKLCVRSIYPIAGNVIRKVKLFAVHFCLWDSLLEQNSFSFTEKMSFTSNYITMKNYGSSKKVHLYLKINKSFVTLRKKKGYWTTLKILSLSRHS